MAGSGTLTAPSAHRHASSVFVVPGPDLDAVAVQAVRACTAQLEAAARSGQISQSQLEDIAAALVQLAGQQGHPLLQASLLSRAGSAVRSTDPARSLALLRESFRLFPSEDVGVALRDLAMDDPAWLRLGRLGRLVQAVAALTDAPERRIAHWLVAARTQIGLGHGRAALDAAEAILSLQPDHEEAAELAAVARSQIEERGITLAAQREALAEASGTAQLDALLAYAELLVLGDEPLEEAAAVLADALQAGASPAQIAPLWVELARAMGDPAEQARALSVAVSAGEALPGWLAYADELINLPDVDRRFPHESAIALTAMVQALPDDAQLRARLEVCEYMLDLSTAEPKLDAMRLRCLRDRDKVGECQACLMLAHLALVRSDRELAERNYRRVRTLLPTHAEALDFFERMYREAGDWRRLQVALLQRQSAAEGRELIAVTAELARISQGPLASPERAMEAWERVLQLQPDHQEAATSLVRLYEDAGRWTGLRDVLEAEARMAEARLAIDPTARARAAAAWRRMAALHEMPGALASRTAALTSWRAALHLNPVDAESLERIKPLLLAAGRPGDWSECLRDAVLAGRREAGVAVATRLQWAREWSALAMQLGRRDDAKEALQEALQLDPNQPDLAQRLVQLARADGDRTALRTALRPVWQPLLGKSPHELDAEALSSHTDLLREAALLAAAAGDAGEAVQLWQAVERLQPGLPEAVSGVVSHWNSEPAGLRVWLAEAAQRATAPNRRAGVWSAWITAAEADGAPAEAEQAARSWLQADPNATYAREALARALLAQERWTEVRAALPSTLDGASEAIALLLTKAAEATGPGEFTRRERARALAADILATELGEPLAATQVAADLAVDPDLQAQPVALQRQVAERVLRLAESAGQESAVAALAVQAAAQLAALDPEPQPASQLIHARWLDRAGAHQSAWVEAVGAIEALLLGDLTSHGDTLAEAWALVQSAALAAGQVQDVADQVASWAELLGNAPLAAQMWQTLLDWSETTTLDAGLVERALAALAARNPHDAAVARRAARTAAERGDLAGAARILQAAALAAASTNGADDPGLTEAWLEAERAAAASSGDAQGLQTALRTCLGWHAQASWWRELAQSYAETEQPEAAARAWLEALNLDADTPSEPVVAAIASLAEQGKADAVAMLVDALWPVLEARTELGLLDALLQLQLTLLADAESRGALWLRLIGLRGHSCGDLEGAFAAACTWLGEQADSEAAAAAVEEAAAQLGPAVDAAALVSVWLDALYQAAADHQPALLARLQAALDAATTGASAANCTDALGAKVQSGSGSKTDLAVAALWLERLQREDRGTDEAAARQMLAASFPAQFATPAARAALAQCWSERAGDAHAALAEWQGLIAEAWEDDAVQQAVTLGVSLGVARDVDEFLQAVAESASDAATRATRQYAIALRAADRGDSALALRLLDAVLLDDPAHTEAYALRGDLLLLTDTDAQQWLNHWTHGREYAPTAEARREASLQVARLWLGEGAAEHAVAAVTPLLTEVGVPLATWQDALGLALAATALDDTKEWLLQALSSVLAVQPERAGLAFAAAHEAGWADAELAELARQTAPYAAEARRWLVEWTERAVPAADRLAALQSLAHDAPAEEQAALWQSVALAALETDSVTAAEEAFAALDLPLAAPATWPDSAPLALVEAALRLAAARGDLPGIASLAERLAIAKEAADDAEAAAALWQQQAAALLDLQQPDAALAALDRALARDDQATNRHLLRAEILLQLGRGAEAWSSLRIGGAPLRAAVLAWQAGEWAEALEALTDALSADAASEALWHTVETLADDPNALGAMIRELVPLWQMAGQYGRAHALRALQVARSTGAAQETARLELAESLTTEGDNAEAWPLWHTLAANANDEANVLVWLSQSADCARAASQEQEWLQAGLTTLANASWSEDTLVPATAMLAETAEAAAGPEAVAAVWRTAWQRQPGQADVRDALLATLRRMGDWQGCAAVLEQAIPHAAESEQAALQLERAEVLRALQEPTAALAATEAAAVLVGPTQAVLGQLEQLVRHPETEHAALSALEALLADSVDADAQAHLLRLRLERAQSAEERERLARALADVLSAGQGGGGAAVATLLELLSTAPSLATLAALEALARPGEDDDALARALEVADAATLPPVDQHAVAERGAAFAARRGDSAGQERWLRRALALDPADAIAREDLESLLDVQGRFAELAELLHHRLQAEPMAPEARELTLHRLAPLAHAVDKRELALWAYRELTALSPNNPDGALGEVELLRELDATEALPAALVRLAALVDDAERAQLLCEAARLADRNLGRVEDAALLYRKALAADPRLDEPFVWLERHQAGKASQLAALYAERAAALPAGPTRVLVRRKLAHALADSGDGLGACEALQAALQDDPANLAVLDELQRLSEQVAAWSILASVLQTRLGVEQRREARIALLGQLARVLLGELGDATAGAPVVDELRLLAPREPLTRHAQAMLQAASGDAREAAEGLEQILKEHHDTATQIALHQQLADLYVGPLDNPARAIRELQKLVQLEPRRWSARRKLCDLYAARQSWEALAESLRQWVAALSGERERETLSLESGHLLAGLLTELGVALSQLRQWPEAVEALRKAVTLGSAPPAATAALAEALLESGAAEEALLWYDRTAEALVPEINTHAADYAHAMAKSAQLRMRGGQLAAAREGFRRALEVSPGHALAMLGSGQVLLALGDIDRALPALEAVTQVTGISNDKLADAWEAIGRCRLAKGQSEQARAAFQTALKVVPGHKAARDGMLSV